jgi:hypothetical protein
VGITLKAADISNHWHSLEYFRDDFLALLFHLFQVGPVEEAHTGSRTVGKSPDECDQSINPWYPALAVSVMVIAMLLIL